VFPKDDGEAITTKNAYDVQEMLGHAKPSITLDIYGEWWKRSREEHAERMEPRDP
jgi:integrase